MTDLDFGGKRIRFEKRGDRMWVSLTDMAAATNKEVYGYTRNKETKDFLTEMESITQICVMVSNVGGAVETTGTWAIEEVAIDFAAWCNVKFRVWVSQQIRTLMTTGTVSIAPPDRPCWIEDCANPWVAFFDKDFCDRVFGWYGAQFYWQFVYKVLTPEEAAKVNRLNPPIAGVRAQRIHQYLTPEAKTRLTPYIGVLVGMVYGARCREDFRLGYADKFGGNDQKRIPGFDK